MSIPAFLNPQRDFSAGQIDTTAERRDDTDILKAAARKLENFDVMLAGGFQRRPSTGLTFYGQNVFDTIEPSNGAIFDIEFRALEFRARSQFGILQSLAAPWTLAQVPLLDWALYENKLIVVGQTMRPQVLEYDADSGTWSIRNFEFNAGLNGMLRQPFYRFATKGITMQPASKATGAGVAVTFSAAVLSAAMVGVEFKWAGRRTKLTAFGTSTTGTFENLEELPPSFRVTLNKVEGYRVGDAVEGATNTSRGQIVSINTGAVTIDVVHTERYDGFSGGEKVVADEAANTVSGSPALQSPFATTVWDEAFMSDFRGWPGSVSVDRQRVIFCDFPQLPGALLESAIGEIEDFELSGDADAAIFELVPQRERVLHVLGGADQFIYTEKTIYYVPISADNPLRPGSMEFRAIGTGGCSSVKPVTSSSSQIYMSGDNRRVMALRQTGQTAQPYVLDHISRYHSQLLNSPVDIAISYGQAVDSDEKLYIVNGDGTLTVGRYDPSADFVGFVPWSTSGLVKGAAAFGQTLKLAVQRTLSNGVVIDTIETLDYALKLDGSVVTANREGGAELIPFAGAQMHRIVAGLYTGVVTIKADGTVAGATGAAETVFGFNYIPRFSPFAPNFDRGESFKQRLRRRKIKRAAVSAQEAGPFKVNNTDLSGYKIGDNLGLPPPPRNQTFTFSVQGRSYDPTFDLTQPLPYGLKITEIGMEVTS